MKVIVGCLLLLLAGCNKQLEDFAKEAVVKPLDPIFSNPNNTVSGPGQIKISPGYIEGTSTSSGIRANITATSIQMSSTSKSAQIGIQRSRTQ